MYSIKLCGRLYIVFREIKKQMDKNNEGLKDGQNYKTHESSAREELTMKKPRGKYVYTKNRKVWKNRKNNKKIFYKKGR